MLHANIERKINGNYTKITYFFTSSGGGGISCDGLRGGVFSFSIIASGASGGGNGLTVFVSIVNLILSTLFYSLFIKEILFGFLRISFFFLLVSPFSVLCALLYLLIGTLLFGTQRE